MIKKDVMWIILAIIVIVFIINNNYQKEDFSISGATCSGVIGTPTTFIASGYTDGLKLRVQDPEKSTRCYSIIVSYRVNGNSLEYYTNSRNLWLYQSNSPISPNCNLGGVTETGRTATCDGTQILNYDQSNGLSSPYEKSVTINPSYKYISLVAADKGQNLDSDNYYGDKLEVKITIPCNPDVSCVLNTCVGSKCTDTCGNLLDGVKNCPSCTPNWVCTPWGPCTSDYSQYRTCTDSNNCGVNTNKPNEGQTNINCANYNPADTNGDGKVSDSEIVIYIGKWVTKQVTDSEIISAIQKWVTTGA